MASDDVSIDAWYLHLVVRQHHAIYLRGNADDVFIIQIASRTRFKLGQKVTFGGGVQAKNIFCTAAPLVGYRFAYGRRHFGQDQPLPLLLVHPSTAAS
jgi:hypothetical protein